jgi:hypothetical protein
MVTEKPLACNSLAKEAATMPLPKEEVTPPVIKMYLVDAICYFCYGVQR